MAAVESNETLLNEPKPLHYAENSQRFASFADKIVHVLLDTETDDKTSYRCVSFQCADDKAMHGHVRHWLCTSIIQMQEGG